MCLSAMLKFLYHSNFDASICCRFFDLVPTNFEKTKYWNTANLEWNQNKPGMELGFINNRKAPPISIEKGVVHYVMPLLRQYPEGTRLRQFYNVNMCDFARFLVPSLSCKSIPSEGSMTVLSDSYRRRMESAYSS